jgi:ribonuclease HI
MPAFGIVMLCPHNGANMSDDPHALKLYTDGNCYKNPGGAGAIACVAKFPESWNRDDEIIFKEGFYETSNNRMELQACIKAHEYVAAQGSALGVQRVLIVTDSLYIVNNFKHVVTWRANKWCNASGRPLENSDLWKRFLTVQAKVKVRTDIVWKKGKKSPTLKMVDRAAKDAGKSPQNVDRGFRSGKVAHSKVVGGSASLYVAHSRNEIIRIYRSGMIRKTGHKITFDLYDEPSASYSQKCFAYADANVAFELHRQHCYRVSFNNDSKHPIILSILEEIACTAIDAVSSITRSEGTADS